MGRFYTYFLPALFMLMPVVDGAGGEEFASSVSRDTFQCMARFDVLEARAAEQYTAALRDIESGNIDKVAATLYALCRDYADIFVPPSVDERRYVGVCAAVRELLNNNAALRTSYDALIVIDETDTRRGDMHELRALARAYPQSAPGRAALLKLAQVYYEAARYEDALWAIMRLKRICGWAAVSVQGRVIALACATELGGFEDIVTQFSKPDLAAKFLLCGKMIAIGEYIAQVRCDLKSRAKYPADNPLFADRLAAMDTVRSSLRVGWSAAMPENEALPLKPQQSAEARHFVEAYPTVSDGMLYLRTRHSVYATSLDRPGQPLWSAQVETDDVKHEIWSGARSRMRRIFPAVCSGGRVFTLAPADDLYAFGEEKFHLLRLVCLDASDGKLLWTRGAKAGEFFAGAPTVIGGSVFAVAVKMQPAAEDRYFLVRLDAATGEEIFAVPISRQQSGKSEGLNLDVLCPPAPPCVRDGVVYVATNAGAVAAFDALFGEPLWALRYDQSNSVAFRSYKNRFERNMNRATSFAYGSPVLCGRTLIVAPPEADRMLAVDAASGRVLWTLDNSRREYAFLLAAQNGAVYLSGEKCAAFACADGRPLWRNRPDAPGFYGRGMLAGGTLLIPAREGLHVFDTANGERLQVDDVFAGGKGERQEGYFGTILFYGERMLAVSKDRITIYNRTKQLSDNGE